LLIVVTLFAASPFAYAQSKPKHHTDHSGWRPAEEMFGGLDLSILEAITKEGTVESSPLYKKYWGS